MKLTAIVSMLALITLCSCATTSKSRAIAQAPNTYIIVHGAWGGGWEFKPLDSALSARGHEVYRLTLTGLGERAHLASLETNLSTHIEDVANTIEFEDLSDVVLVAHSYGGMVATGVAQRMPERLRCVIYFDAFLPEDGESLLTSSRGNNYEAFLQQMVTSARDGFIEHPGQPAPRNVPQPVRTFTETIALNNAAAHAIPMKYILTVEAGADETDDNFAPYATRARARGWPIVVMTGGHVPVGKEWDELARLVEDLLQ